MLKRINELLSCKVQAIDGEMGEIDDFYFDNWEWKVKYLVTDIKKPFFRKKVLICPTNLESLNRRSNSASLSLTKKQIIESPAIDTDQPLDIQHKTNNYAWEFYFAGETLYNDLENDGFLRTKRNKGGKDYNPHLHSAMTFTNLLVMVKNGAVGEIEDFLIDRSWNIKSLIVRLHDRFPQKRVHLPPCWIDMINYTAPGIFVDTNGENIDFCTEYHETGFIPFP